VFYVNGCFGPEQYSKFFVICQQKITGKGHYLLFPALAAKKAFYSPVRD
jgi:hypothetical protein